MKLRTFLTSLVLLLALAAMAEPPKYIFYFIGDGMGIAPVQLTNNYKRKVLGDPQLLTMTQFPVASFCQTWSANNDVTDSAAAGTALSTGYKTNNGMLGVTPDTISVESMAVQLQKWGYGIGLVTSVAPDDATPGAFYAHVASRKMFDVIDTQMAESGYLFVAGQDLRGLEKDGQPTGVLDSFAENNVQIVRGPEGISEINSEKVLLLNSEGAGLNSNNIGYTIDSLTALNLPMMVEAGLKHLEKYSPDKFFMMVEGGNIDHALHANDPGASIQEILAFDKALDIAYKFYSEHPDETLIVVTADHDTGGLAIISPQGAKGGLKNIKYQKISKQAFSNYCNALLKSRQNYTWDDMKQYLADNFGFFSRIKLKDSQEAKLKEMFEQTFERRNSADQHTLYADFNAFAAAVIGILNEASGIIFSTTHHSGNPVPVFAIGNGAGSFTPYNNNVNLPFTILRVADPVLPCRPPKRPK